MLGDKTMAGALMQYVYQTKRFERERRDAGWDAGEREITMAITTATTTKECFQCPTCARPITDAYPYLPSMYAQSINGLLTGASSVDLVNGAFGAPASDEGSPLVVPPGPLATAAFESGMSAVEELRRLKTQVQDVSRVCQAVARGDLSQKIEVPVQGVVMVQLKDVINTMVSPFCACQMFCFIALDLMRVDFFFLYLLYLLALAALCGLVAVNSGWLSLG